MKGVILAGGRGTRLNPVTSLLPKSLIPVYDKPMIFYPLDLLIKAGISEILIVIDHFQADKFLKYLHSGKEFGINIHYKIQDEPNGLPDALLCAEKFVGDDNCMVVLGDNLVFDNLQDAANSFASGAQSFVYEVPDPERFGILYLDDNGNITDLVEKPPVPMGNLALTGAYIFDSTVFSKIRKLSPSVRGELEIVDLLKLYLMENSLTYKKLTNAWFDVGTFDSLLEAANYISNSQKND